MHGGISPDLISIKQLEKIERQAVIPESGVLCDLLWADPDKGIDFWERNERGISFAFGPKALQKFL